MITAWEWVKAHAEYVYAGLILALAVWSFADGDTVGGVVCAGIAVAYFVLVKFLLQEHRLSGGTPPKPLTFEQGEMDAIRRLGAEPMPIPGENQHDPAVCIYCKRWEEIR